MALVRRALISVSDKTGITDLARELAARGIEIISTGGTAKAIADAGIPVLKVADVTGQREILDGRVKTLHPRIHGGLLARKDHAADMATLRDEDIASIDLLVVNLYPFEATLAKGADFATCVENIDIGGPAMLRAAAKNHQSVLVLTDPADYPDLLSAIDAGTVDPAWRRGLARKAFALTARYDAAIQTWLAGETGDTSDLTLTAHQGQSLRYGENPHQKAAVYRLAGVEKGVAGAELVQGKALSYNNLLDADAALGLVREFSQPTVVIVKHMTPCGAASHDDLALAYRLALAGDPISAFGGIVALNRPLDAATAREVVKIFTEVVIAPGADPDARAIMAGKSQLRLMLTGEIGKPAASGRTLRSISGGLLVQDRDNAMIGATDLLNVTRRTASKSEIDALLFAWRVVKHVRSNAIAIARGPWLLGQGGGQTNRVDAVHQAAIRARATAARAGDANDGWVLASDAFFPFADGLQAGIDAGVTAVIQPGGSMRDEEVTAAADAAGVAMVFTGQRHFRH